MRKSVVIGLVLAATTAACGSDAGDGETTVAPEPVPTVTNSPESRPAPEDLPDRVPSSTAAGPGAGEADPGLVASIKQDLIDRTGANESEISVSRAEEAIWNDGSLGCAEPGQIYTQAIVNGFWVVLEYGGQTFDYRATGSGSFKLCEGFAAPPGNPTG